MPEVTQPKYLTDQEIQDRIYALSAADHVRLERAAAIYAHGTDWSEGDLLQEGFIAALARRQWRADLDAVVFLTGAMRSLAHSKRKSRRHSPLDRALATGEDQEEALQQLPDTDDQDPANIAAADEALELFVEELQRCFESDEQVQQVIRGRAAGDSPAAIKNALGLSQSEYETVCRRLLRGYQTRMKAVKV